MIAKSHNNYTLHILIPELFTHYNTLKSELHLNALEKLLSRATIEDWAYPEWMQSLFAHVGLSVTQKPLPIAPLTRLSDAQDSGNKIWLRADPVYLRANRDRVFLFDAASAFTVTPTEANTLINEINALYAEDGLQFSAPTPTRWYVSLPKMPQLITQPLATVLGCDIHDYMPEGVEKMVWRLRLNEIQMLLHQSKINTEREARGEFPINSVWFWGLGQLPAPPPSPPTRWAQIWSDEPLAQGLARLTNTPQSHVPASGTDWLAQLTPGEHLLTLFAPRMATKKLNWSEWLNNLEQLWFAPLFKALKKHQVERIIIYPGDKRVFVITDRQVRQWWRWLMRH